MKIPGHILPRRCRTLLARVAVFVASLLAVSTLVDNLSSIRQTNLNKRLNPGHRLLFEANQGQAPEKYRFLARDQFGVFLLGGNEFVYGKGRDVVHLIFAGANQQPQVSGLDQQAGRVNYLVGKDSSRWIRNISSYARVRVDELYPGIDAVYYGSQGILETDFVVQPRSNPESIRLRVDGGGRPSITAAGDLQVYTTEGLFELRKPNVYQNIGGSRRQVACRYAVRDRNEISFVISSYDPSQPLVIDPVLSYSSYLGGGNSTAVRVAVDRQGNAYLAGATTASNYPVTSGAIPPSPPSGRDDVLITKFNSKGALLYSTHVGGSGDDIGLAIAVDAKGQAYVTGSTVSRDFPTVAAFQAARQGHGNAFVFALNAAGSDFVYSTYFGGSALDSGTAIAVDAQGNAYVAGMTSSANFPTKNALQGSLKGSSAPSLLLFLIGDAFVAKFAPAGTLVYSTYYGGSSADAALAIAVDANGSAYVAGFTTSTDFPLKSPLQADYGGAGANSQITTGDAFVFKLSPDGSQAVYSTYLGGSADDVACGIAVDSSGNAYLAGSTFSTNFPVANAFQEHYGGQGIMDYFRMSSGDGFVAKINPSGSALIFSTYLGGSDDDRVFAIAVDGAGNVHVAGNTASTNFPVTSDAAQTRLGGVGVVDTINLLPGGYVKAPAGFGDAFYARFSPSGSLTYNTYLGGSDDDVASGLAVDSAGNAYLSGNTASANFPLAGSSYQKQLGGIIAQNSSGNEVTSLLFGDAFFAMFSVSASPGPVISGAVSASAFGEFSSVAPGSWVEIYGKNLAPDTQGWTGADFTGNEAPTMLNGVSVSIGGQAAFVDYISPTQVNAQLPSNIATRGTLQLTVTNGGATSAPVDVTVNPTEPGLLAPASFKIGGKQYVVAQHSDGTYVLPVGAIAGVTSSPAKPGETVVIYGVGFGPVTPNIPAGEIATETNKLATSFEILFGQTSAALPYFGLAPNYVGLYQFNVTVPTVSNNDLVPLTFKLGGTIGVQTLFTAVEQ
jgi:uncharacterized protein (TIGR03437 family)